VSLQSHVFQRRAAIVRNVHTAHAQVADNGNDHRRLFAEFGHFTGIHEFQHGLAFYRIFNPFESLLQFVEAVPGGHTRTASFKRQIADLVAHFLIAYNDESPGLIVFARRRPAGRLKDFVDHFIRHRIRFVSADTLTGIEDLQELITEFILQYFNGGICVCGQIGRKIRAMFAFQHFHGFICVFG